MYCYIKYSLHFYYTARLSLDVFCYTALMTDKYIYIVLLLSDLMFESNCHETHMRNEKV